MEALLAGGICCFYMASHWLEIGLVAEGYVRQCLRMEGFGVLMATGPKPLPNSMF